MSARRLLLALLSAVLVLTASVQASATTSYATSTETVASQSSQLDVSSVSPSATTRTCSTGGPWYQVDTFYVTRAKSGSNWKYTVSWGGNRTLFVGHPYYDYWGHMLTRSKITDGYGSSTKFFPGKTFSFTRKSPNAKVQMWVLLNLNHGQHTFTKTCTVYFT